MIANTAGSHSNFGGAINYITREDKCERVEIRNLLHTTADEISREMKFEVERINKGRPDQKKMTTPVYHVSISWAEKDNLTIEEKMQIGQEFIDHMGLDEHQAVIASHDDKDHGHIHIVANRVHPETGKRWEPYLYDGKGPNRHIVKGEYERHEEFLREAEREHEWTQVQGVNAENPKRDFDRTRALSQGEHKNQERLEKAAASLGMVDVDIRSVKERAAELKDELYKAESFKEFDRSLAKNGLYVKQKGPQGGAVISDGSSHVKASDISRGLSGPKLQDKFGETLSQYEQRREETIDIQAGEEQINQFLAKHIQQVADSVQHQAEFKVNSHEESMTRLKLFKQEITPARDKFQKHFNKAYKNPAKAIKKFEKRAGEIGIDRIRGEMKSNPEKFGALENKGQAKETAKAIKEMEQVAEAYPNHYMKQSDSQRDTLIDDHKTKMAAWNNLKAQASKVISDGFRESESGQAISESASNVISIARAAKQIAENPKKVPFQVSQELLIKARSKINQDSGQAIGKIMQSSMRGGKTAVKLMNNPTQGSVRLMKQIIQSGTRSAGRASRIMGGG